MLLSWKRLLMAFVCAWDRGVSSDARVMKASEIQSATGMLLCFLHDMIKNSNIGSDPIDFNPFFIPRGFIGG